MRSIKVRLIIVIILGSFINCSESDDFDEIVRKADTFYAAGKYERVIEICKRGISVSRKKYGKDNVLETYYLGYLGAIYYKLGKYDDAEISLLNALELYKKYNLYESCAAASSQGLLAKVYMQKERYIESESLLFHSIDASEKNECEDAKSLNLIKYQIGMSYYYRGYYNKAESLFVDFLNKYEDDPDLNYVNTIEIYMFYALSLYRQTRIDELIELLNYWDKKCDNICPDDYYGIVYPKLALNFVYKNQDNRKKADSLYFNSLKILNQICEDDPDITSQLCYELSNFYDLWGYESEAQEYLQKAENLKAALEQDLDPDPEDLNLYLNR